jgi:ATP-dependent RNA helicase DDX5/DBP2
MAGQLFVRFLKPTLPVAIANSCLAIHGDKQQNERDWVLNEFKTGKSPIMVATDVASRGIGMKNCDPPLSLPSPLPFPP